VIFTDRHHAGRLLSEKLTSYRNTPGIVLGLVRGGIVVAYEIAKSLELPLDALVVKKIPSPSEPELGIGALAPDNVSYIDWRLAQRVGADEAYIKRQTTALTEVIREKLIVYRRGRKPLNVKGKVVILVDDGVATGATFEAAVKWLRKKKADKIVAAIPVAPVEILDKMTPEVADLLVIERASDLHAVGQFYSSFPQVEDTEVIAILKKTV
jgi:putative phosphoribosyl transferase